MLTYSYIATDHFYIYNKTLIIININSVAPLYSTNNCDWPWENWPVTHKDNYVIE